VCAGAAGARFRAGVTGGGPVSGQGRAVLVAGVALLRPEEQVLEAMLAGWAGQQAARGLGGETISGRQGRIRSFTDHAGCPPWLWTAQLFDEWCADLRSVHHVAASTLRGQAGAVRLFCQYLTDPAYAWAEVCWGYFGTHPVQVCTRWNTPRHVQDGESGPERRAFTVAELQVLFDHLDDRVAAVHASGRKGWLPAFRDAVLVKTAYAFGLRRREVAMLDLADLSANPRAPEFAGTGSARSAMARRAPGRRRGGAAS
jgi:integrase/recombinase XerC